MNDIQCPGLPANWLNAWLAAIGLLVLEPRLRLHWTTGESPIAALTAYNGADPLKLAADAWPDEQRLKEMPIAERIDDHLDMKRTVPLDVFWQRAQLARGHTDSWTLSSTVTDLCVDVSGSKITVRHAPLDPKGPGTIKWLHHRLTKCYEKVNQMTGTSPSAVLATLQGHGKRVIDNGLGFDATRITGLADHANKVVDPVIEVLAFFGLRILPMRGKGTEVLKSSRRDPSAALQRCWAVAKEPARERAMTWPAWRQPLDFAGIDALLDMWSQLSTSIANQRRSPRAELSRLGIHSAWRTKSYQSRGSSDNTVGFISHKLAL